MPELPEAALEELLAVEELLAAEVLLVVVVVLVVEVVEVVVVKSPLVGWLLLLVSLVDGVLVVVASRSGT